MIVMGEDNDCNVPSQYEGDLQEHSPIPTLTTLSEELPANEMMTETHCSYSEEKDVYNETGLAENLIDLTFKLPSDPFNLENKPIAPELIRLLLKIGPCQPGKDNDYDFLNTGTSTRKFQKNWYTKRLPNGLTVERQWLTYSPVKNGKFCFLCLLFSNKSAHGYDKTFADASAGCQNYKKSAEKK